ncbi:MULTISPECIES: hypothetical protein [unclassified Mesorhizobium]|nr:MULTISPECIES: hypothetical protein [unclassified Mesorhizobium]MDG4889520.1 hypothetical protein [Mesorhizobium sp. WSM4887]
MVRLAPETLGSRPVLLVYRREIGDEAPVRRHPFVTVVIRDQATVISGKA